MPITAPHFGLVEKPKEELMEIESQLDAWSYQQRLRDATIHSQSVTREYPVALVKPSVSAHDGTTHFHPYRRTLKDDSRESFLRKLQEVDAENEYGQPPHPSASSKKNQKQKQKKKKDKEPINWSPQDPLESFRKHSQSLAQLLSKTLDKRISSSNGRKAMAASGGSSRSAASTTLFIAAKRHEQKALVPSVSKEKPDLKNQDEINELEVLLRNQRLSRSAKDDFFYKNITERETNILLAEVCHDLFWEVAIETYEQAELAARKKELPPEELAVVVSAMDEGPADRVLIQKYQVDITRRTLQCLKPLQWLNDEVINFYLQLLNDRDEALVKNGLLPKRSHFFNSFFYTKVSEGGYNFINVRRWTRKIDLFAMDKIFVPVNISNTHWCMAVIFMTEKRIQYYDSMSGSGSACLKVLLRYLHDEMEHKKSAKFSGEGWELVTTTESTPQQANGSDCGVFSCMFADFLSLNKPLLFTQKDMEFHRHRMVLRIVQGSLPLEEDM